jgi:hypothetical protein
MAEFRLDRLTIGWEQTKQGGGIDRSPSGRKGRWDADFVLLVAGPTVQVGQKTEGRRVAIRKSIAC